MRYLTLLLVVIFIPLDAAANMANPYRAGDMSGELGGDVGELIVEHEDLVVDLRPFPEHGHAKIQATYEISNPSGEPTAVPLQFVAAAMQPDADTPSVTLDGEPLGHRVVEDAPLRGSWTLRPLKIWEGAPEAQSQGTGPSLFFDATLPPGTSTIRVEYAARPARNAWMPTESNLAGGIQRFNTYTVPYVLEPAREWGAFGAIDLEVKAPTGWATSVAPGADAKGRIKSADEPLPAPVLLVQFKPTIVHDARVVAGLIGGIVVFLLLLFGGARLTGRIIRRFIGNDTDGPRELGYEVLEVAFVSIFAGLALPAGIMTMSLLSGSGHTYPGWGYFLFFTVPLAAPVLAFAAAIVQVILIRRRRSR